MKLENKKFLILGLLLVVAINVHAQGKLTNYFNLLEITGIIKQSISQEKYIKIIEIENTKKENRISFDISIIQDSTGVIHNVKIVDKTNLLTCKEKRLIKKKVKKLSPMDIYVGSELPYFTKEKYFSDNKFIETGYRIILGRYNG